MVGNTGTLVTMRIVRNRLRKRDISPASTAEPVDIELQQRHNQTSRTINTDNIVHFSYNEPRSLEVIYTNSLPDNNDISINSAMKLENITFARRINSSTGWIFPPEPPSPNIYNCVDNDAGQRNVFKGFKKQFSGRFRRLVSHKKDVASPIPPELKSQLKTIYVY